MTARKASRTRLTNNNVLAFYFSIFIFNFSFFFSFIQILYEFLYQIMSNLLFYTNNLVIYK